MFFDAALVELEAALLALLDELAVEEAVLVSPVFFAPALDGVEVL